MNEQREEWAARYPNVVGGPLDTTRVCRGREEAMDLVQFVRSRGAEAYLLRRLLTVHDWEEMPL